jgi:hypothetical protein
VQHARLAQQLLDLAEHHLNRDPKALDGRLYMIEVLKTASPVLAVSMARTIRWRDALVPNSMSFKGNRNDWGLKRTG